MARGLPADWPSRSLCDVRGVCDDFGLDDRAAHEMAGGGGTLVLAGANRVAEHPADVNVLEERSQRLQPPGPGTDRRGPDKARNGFAYLPAARRELPAIGRGSLPAQPQLREPYRDRQAAAVAVAGHEDRDRALHERRVDLGVGGHGWIWRTRRRACVSRRYSDT